MKIEIVMKDPDGVWDSLEDAGFDPNNLHEDVERLLKKYFTFNEVICLELDLDEQTITVVPK